MPELVAPLVSAELLAYTHRRGSPWSKAGVRAVDGVDISIPSAASIALVGESGSGKTTLARLLLRLLKPTSGRVRFDGVDLATCSTRSMRDLRRRMQIVFQDPFASFDPLLTIGSQIAEPMKIHEPELSRSEISARVGSLAAEVVLPSACLAKLPRELSAGQLQRASLARALALSPEFLVADEPVSALDTSLAHQILDLLDTLHHRHAMALLTITHDMRVARRIAGTILVMHAGRIVEAREAAALLDDPLHPYTRALLADDTRPRPRPRPVQAGHGCAFASECEVRQPECAQTRPAPVECGSGWVACYCAGAL